MLSLVKFNRSRISGSFFKKREIKRGRDEEREGRKEGGRSFSKTFAKMPLVWKFALSQVGSAGLEPSW